MLEAHWKRMVLGSAELTEACGGQASNSSTSNSTNPTTPNVDSPSHSPPQSALLALLSSVADCTMACLMVPVARCGGA
eukprot:3898884-Rhodomonas_salina.1